MKHLLQFALLCSALPLAAQTKLTMPACVTPRQTLAVVKNTVTIPQNTCGAFTFTVPAGVAGPVGKTGAQGVQGIQGVAGQQGVQGVAGQVGSQGLAGVAGPPGTATGAYTMSCLFNTANTTTVNGVTTYSGVTCTLTPAVAQ